MGGRGREREEDWGWQPRVQAGPGVLGWVGGEPAFLGWLLLFQGLGAGGKVAWACRRHRWAMVGQEPVGFQEGKLKIPPSRHGWNPERTGIQFPSCCRRRQGVVTRRATQQQRQRQPCGAGRCWGLEPRLGIYWLSPWAGGRGQGRADVLLEAQQLCLSPCQAAHCILRPPISRQSLHRSRPGLPEPACHGAHVWGHLSCCLGQQFSELR